MLKAMRASPMASSWSSLSASGFASRSIAAKIGAATVFDGAGLGEAARLARAAATSSNQATGGGSSGSGTCSCWSEMDFRMSAAEKPKSRSSRY